jgi:endonuclease III
METSVFIRVINDSLCAIRDGDGYILPDLYFPIDDVVFAGVLKSGENIESYRIIDADGSKTLTEYCIGSTDIDFRDIDNICIKNISVHLSGAIRDFLKIRYIFSILLDKYPDAVCTLEQTDPMQLMVSIQLSAQCTDKMVNIVTKELFKRYKTIGDYADADLKELESYIRPTGFYRNKAKNIRNLAVKLRDKYNGIFPDTLEEMLKLDGVGRKTGNLFLSEFYKLPGMVVDTHVKRISRRLGLTKSDDPEKIEYDLRNNTEKKNWSALGHLIIYFGRDICKARRPECGRCSFKDICEYYKDIK